MEGAVGSGETDLVSADRAPVRRRWTAADIPDLTGQVAVVTGANSGLGWHTARELARHGAHVVLACRDGGRGEAAVDRLVADVPGASVALGALDLADLASVRDFAGRVADVHRDGINLLVANAGVMATPYRRTADGFELQMGTNHLGHFALTGLLLPTLLARPGARVVVVASLVHRRGRVRPDRLMPDAADYQRWEAYAASKLANLLFVAELDRRTRAAGVDLLAVAAHPGYASTNLQLAGPRMAGNRVAEWLSRVGNALIGQSDAQGALPQLYAATMPDVRGGDYYGPDRLKETRGQPTRVGRAPAAADPDLAARLWEVSEELTGVRFALLEDGGGPPGAGGDADRLGR